MTREQDTRRRRRLTACGALLAALLGVGTVAPGAVASAGRADLDMPLPGAAGSAVPGLRGTAALLSALTAPGSEAPRATAEGQQAAPTRAATTRAATTRAASADRRPPVEGRPVRAYRAPPHEYGPGHRGVDLPAVAGAPVLAPADGRVTFAGPVAGRGVVVVEHADGTLTSLEPVLPVVAVGTSVGLGDPVARVAPSPPHAGCPGGCVHWGVRVAGRYVDPWWWLGRTRAVRLLPSAGALNAR